MALQRKKHRPQRATKEELAVYDVPRDTPEPTQRILRNARSGRSQSARISNEGQSPIAAATQASVEVPNVSSMGPSVSPARVGEQNQGHESRKHVRRNASADRRVPETGVLMSGLDPSGYWADIVTMSNELSSESGLEGVSSIALQLRDHLASIESDELAHDQNLKETMQEIRQNLDNLTVTSKRVYEGFTGGGLNDLVALLQTLFHDHSGLLSKMEDLSVLKLTVDLMRSIVSLSDRIRIHLKLRQTSLPRREAAITTRLRLLSRRFQREIESRESMLEQRLYITALREAHEQIRERNQVTTRERRSRTNPPVPIAGLGSLATGSLKALQTASDGPHRPSGVVWTVEMDEELLESLFMYRDLPLSERYRQCLLRPSLQNLLEEHIYERALCARPSWIASYEDEGQSVPSWVTSIQ